MGIFTSTPGGSVSVSRNLQPLLDYTVGYADIESKDPLSLDHRYNIASQTKTVTAIAIMQLVEKEYISLDDKAARYIPSLKRASSMHSEITIQHLLTHTAGLRRDMPNNNYWEGTSPFPTEEQLLAVAQEESLVFNPGQKMKYSNLGYALLGTIISKVTDSSYQQYVHDAIIEPLELQSMSFKANHPDYPLACGYSMVPSASNPFRLFDTDALSPAAGLWANSLDTRRLFEILLPISEPAQMRIGLSNSSIRRMITSDVSVNNSGGVEYGLGVDIGYSGSNRVIGHGGGSLGYRSGTAIDVEHNVVVSAFANQINHDAFMDSISILDTLRHIIQDTSEVTTIPSDHQVLLRNEWGYKQMFSLGNRLAAIDPTSRTPFAEESVEILELISDATYKVVRANGFNVEGENVVFTDISSGVVNFAGRTMMVEGYASHLPTIRDADS